MTVRHLLNVTDHGGEGLRRMIQLALDDEVRRAAPLQGRGVAMVFEKPSNRTRHSMEMAVVQMGGHPIYTRGDEVGIDQRESAEDIARILAGYHAVIAARVFRHSVLERMAGVSPVPVINMLSDESHPLQALADIITMNEVIGDVAGRTIAWVGDYNNVARSLGEAVCLLGGCISFGCPEGYGPTAEEVTRLTGLGGAARSTTDPFDAVADADVVHTDTWISMGQEAESEVRRKIFAPYQVTRDLMSRSGRQCWFMHCMPAHRGEEVSAEVFDGPRSLVIAQGHHRLTSARGALAFVLEQEKEARP